MAIQREQDRNYRRLLGIGLAVSLAIHGVVLGLGQISVPALDGTDGARSADESHDPDRWRQRAIEVVQLRSHPATTDEAASPASQADATPGAARRAPAVLDAAPRMRRPRSAPGPTARPVSRSQLSFPEVELERRRPSYLHSQVAFTAASRAARDAGGKPGAVGGESHGPGTDYVFPGDADGGGGITITGSGGGCSGPVIGTIGGVRYFSPGAR